jgi:hypothetical protein
MAEIIFDRADDRYYGQVSSVVTGFCRNMAASQLYEPIDEGIIPLVISESGSVFLTAENGPLPIALAQAHGYITFGGVAKLEHTHFDIALRGRCEEFVGVSRMAYVVVENRKCRPNSGQWQEMTAPLRSLLDTEIEMTRLKRSVVIRTLR